MNGSTLVIFGFALGAALLVFLRTRRNRRLRPWRELADEVELEYADHGWWRGVEVSGTYRGAKVAVSTERGDVRPGRSRRTVYRTELPDGFPREFAVELRGAGLGDSEPGGDLVETGSSELDDQWRVRSDDPARVRQLLSPDPVASELQAFRSPVDDVRIAEGELEVAEGGRTVEGSELRSTLDRVARLREALGEVSQGVSPGAGAA